MCCLNTTFNRLVRSDRMSEEAGETLMEMCLGLFYAPSRTIPEEVSNSAP